MTSLATSQLEIHNQVLPLPLSQIILHSSQIFIQKLVTFSHLYPFLAMSCMFYSRRFDQLSATHFFSSVPGRSQVGSTTSYATHGDSAKWRFVWITTGTIDFDGLVVRSIATALANFLTNVVTILRGKIAVAQHHAARASDGKFGKKKRMAAASKSQKRKATSRLTKII